MMRNRMAALVAVGLTVAVAGCGGSGDNSSKTIVVDAAASLMTSFTALGQQFEQAHPGTKVNFNFGGSDQLAAQITAGAPVDVFAAASPATMATVTAKDDTVAAPTTFARNVIEIATPPSNPKHIGSLADTVRPGVTLVICAPTVPCGATAAATYSAAGLTPHPASQEENVTAVLTKLELDQADAGIVYRTDVRGAGAKVHGVSLPMTPQSVTSYPIAVTKNGHGRSVAQQFEAFVLSATGHQALQAAGFLNP